MQATLVSFFSAASISVPRPRFGYSSQLCREAIDEGAHVLITAHPEWADYVSARTEVVERLTIGSEQLVVIGRAGATASGGIAALTDGSLRRVAVPSTESDPVGMYAREAMLRYGIWSQMQSTLMVTAGSDEAIAALSNGVVDAAIVFSSSAAAAQLPVIFAIDPAFHRPILLEALLLSEEIPQARELFDFLSRGGGSAGFVSRQPTAGQ